MLSCTRRRSVACEEMLRDAQPVPQPQPQQTLLVWGRMSASTMPTSVPKIILHADQEHRACAGPMPSHPFCETVEISLTCIVGGQEILRGHPFRLGACFLSQRRPITGADVVVDGPLLTGIYHAKISIRVPVFAWGNLLAPWRTTLNLLLGSIQPVLSPMPCYSCLSRSFPVT